ncbi:DUF4097 family beta strand repeat-containing protein [Mycobacterium noviomagense]|uniref:DUF4097 domain-containing protein n=1 Tax=Mycobacterium noviomagense TaxID=459858 RepID=A0A7I7PH52_9MYCO|nr:DUF4097 family beta strand repeat-containing protein [Mycobacterium noviomagense]ORB14119.1 hypothetical protein BST37_11900 [Mycobacterium noviomagense]BBY07934.1 hypothetical protein MNVI_32520 [Mycobacterium noviomagense]
MPTFHTPQPITASIQAAAGSVRLVATDRDDTVAEVRPHDPSRQADVRSAEEARISYANGKLAVAPAKHGFLGYRMGAVDIVVELPSHSSAQVSVASADVHSDGDLAEFRFASASGNLALQSISGRLKAATSSGNVDVGVLDGDTKFQAASGALSIGHLRGHLKSQTSSGSVSIAAAVSGAALAHTSSGAVQIGIPEGTAAQLDVMTGSGTVTNRLEPSDGPKEGEETLLVRVRTGSGDVDIHRAVQAHGTING